MYPCSHTCLSCWRNFVHTTRPWSSFLAQKPRNAARSERQTLGINSRVVKLRQQDLHGHVTAVRASQRAPIGAPRWSSSSAVAAKLWPCLCTKASEAIAGRGSGHSAAELVGVNRLKMSVLLSFFSIELNTISPPRKRACCEILPRCASGSLEMVRLLLHMAALPLKLQLTPRNCYLDGPVPATSRSGR